MMQPITPFDRSQFYAAEIAPRVEEIKKLCEANGIPFFCEFAVLNGEWQTQYQRDGLMPRSMGITLHTNTVIPHVLVARGYRPLAPETIEEFLVSDMTKPTQESL